MVRFAAAGVAALVLAGLAAAADEHPQSYIGREVAIPHHLQDGDEFTLPLQQLLAYGKKLFEAHFTSQEGAGRPLTKGTGAPLSDPGSPLTFPRNNNRLSGPRPDSAEGPKISLELKNASLREILNAIVVASD